MKRYMATIMVSYDAEDQTDANKVAKLLADTSVLGVHSRRSRQIETCLTAEHWQPPMLEEADTEVEPCS